LRATSHKKKWAALAAASVICGASWIAIGRGPVPAVPPEPPRSTGPLAPSTSGHPEGESEIPFASAHAAAVTTPSAPGAWGGPRSGKEPTLSDRVVAYRIQAKLDPKLHTVDGQEQLTWRNRSDRAVKSVYLHLYLNAFEGPGSTFMSEERDLRFEFRSAGGIKDGQWGHIALEKVRQNGSDVPWRFVHPDGGPQSDHTVVRLDLPAPVPPGAATTLDIGFRDQLPRVVARTGWWASFHMVAQWFPKIGVLELPGERGATSVRWNVHEFHMHSEFYADWGEYDVRMTVPKGFQVASAGEEQGAPVENGGLVTHHFVQGDIHDFAWMAASDFAPPLESAYDGPGSPHVTVRVFYPPEYRPAAVRALQATIDSIRWFSDTLGPYPYRTSTCIIPPMNATEAGGMEYQTIFTAEGSNEVEPDTISDFALDFVTIHEFGHGYFYGLLASNEFEEPLLDEGLNEYWDMRMMRARHQDVHLTTPGLKRLGIAPTMSGFTYEHLGGALDPHPPDPLGQNSWDRLSSGSYGTVYRRTATVMHDLEERLGHEVTERAFKRYYALWHFRHPSTADLREALAEAAGDRAVVDDVFRRHVYGLETVDDWVEGVTSAEELPQPGTFLENGQWVERTHEAVDKEIERKRSEWAKTHPRPAPHGPGPFPYRTTVTVRRSGAPLPQTLLVTFEDGSTERLRWDDDRRWARFVLVRPIQVRSAELDPEQHYLLDGNKLNDGRRRERETSASRRWTGDIAAFFEVLAGALEALL
jgi:hypothetical protein